MTIMVRRSGANANATVKVRRSGAWVDAIVNVRRSGAWVQAYAPGSPLTGVSVTLTGGAGPFNVSGASGGGALGSAGTPGFVQSTVSGGYPPVNETVTIVGGGGKIALYDTGQGDGAIGWTGMAIGETQTFYISASATDSHGTNQTARYPASGTISITRTS